MLIGEVGTTVAPAANANLIINIIVALNLKDGWTSQKGGDIVYPGHKVKALWSIEETHHNLSESNNEKYSFGKNSMVLFKVIKN